MKTGYSEKIPFGIVETSNRFYGLLHFEYNTNVQVDLSLGYEMIENSNNQKDNSINEFYGSLSLWFSFSKMYIFQ